MDEEVKRKGYSVYYLEEVTRQEITKVLDSLEEIPDEKLRNEVMKIIIKWVSEELKKENTKNSYPKEKDVIEENGCKYIKFKKKEIENMPDNLKKLFAVNDKIVSYRIIDGVYQARFRRDGYNIEVASKNFDMMKIKFLERLKQEEEKRLHRDFPKFKVFIEGWLKIKKTTLKETTYNSYKNIIDKNLIPSLGEMYVNQITRQELQDYLFSFVEQGKNRTAQKIKQLLSAMFEILCGDFPEINNPTKRLVLGHYEARKGKAFTKEEETIILEYIKKNPNCSTNSSILVMLYTGMRIGELKTLKVEGDFITCISEKTRKGYKEVIRHIPISPMMKKILPLIDFEKAKNSKGDTIRLGFKKIFPDRHCHEFRYTFITRAKECGCNQEAVMLWAGHEFDKDVVTSRVDRGYTTYSKEYFLKEIEKINYELPKIA